MGAPINRCKTGLKLGMTKFAWPWPKDWKPKVEPVGHFPERTGGATMTYSTEDPDYVSYEDKPGYLGGGKRTFGAFFVCLECGAQVDAEFTDKHTEWHGKKV
jgi:hypothetical protein